MISLGGLRGLGAASTPLALLLAVALGCGCDAFDDSLLPEGASVELRRPPERPGIADGPDAHGVIYFALKEPLLNQAGDVWRSVGFDLDGLDSQSPDPIVECLPARPSAAVETDGEQGIDNAFGHSLFPVVELAVENLDVIAAESQAAGIGSILVALRGWNGEDDDPTVHITIAQSVFAVAANADGSMPEVTVDGFDPLVGGLPAPPPIWDGRDWFWIREQSFVTGDPDLPHIVDDNAYIRDRQLVIRLPDRVDIILPGLNEGLLVRLTGGVASGRISEDLTRLETVTVGGRWSINDMLETARAIGVCPDGDVYRVVARQIDATADVRSAPDTGGPDVLCDAVSIGVTFQGYRANWAALVPGQPLVDLCTAP